MIDLLYRLALAFNFVAGFVVIVSLAWACLVPRNSPAVAKQVDEINASFARVAPAGLVVLLAWWLGILG